MLILDVNKLSKNFGYGQLFEDVSFSLNEGESISIVGPNGCGKSTLLKMIAGIEKVDKGCISIKRGVKIAYLDQTCSSIDDARCVYDILKDVLRLVSVFHPAGFIKKTSKNFRFWLDKFEIDDILNDVLHFVPQLRCRKADD